jgi:hypothetical protein
MIWRDSWVALLLPAGEREAASREGAAELIERLWPYAMELLDLGLADLG